MNVVCFHGEDEENGYLSNWYSSPFALDGVSFSSMEQYMMLNCAPKNGLLATRKRTHIGSRNNFTVLRR